MRPRLLTVLATGALTLSLLGPTGAQAVPPEIPPGPSLPEQASATAGEQATDALAEAQALFEDRSRAEARELLAAGGADATMALDQLIRTREDLSPSQRKQADAMLARPTDEGGDVTDYGTFEYEDGEETPVCGDTICIHYAVPSDSDAPPATDTSPANGVPDEVDQALATAEDVNATYVDSGYRRPDGDGRRGGQTNLVDIYLADTGDVGLYGYCTVDDGSSGRHRPAYCVIDNDFTDFDPPNTPEENQQVTLAHEYFHAVQYAYDVFEDSWIKEATATWAEDELFDDVNDNWQYLDAGQGANPYHPLDLFDPGLSNHYGNWVFFRYLSERWPAETGSMPRIVRSIWEMLSARPGARDLYSTQALQTVLARRGTGFTPVYGQFVAANRAPAQNYSEGGAGAYPVADPGRAGTWTLRRGKRKTARFQVQPAHLASIPLRYRPGSGTGPSDWRLRLKVDMPAKKTAPVAKVLVRRDNGGVSTSSIRLNRNGVGSTTAPFSSRSVQYVELLVVNASRRTRCRTGSTPQYFACDGTPRDDGVRTVFSAESFRR